MFFTFPEDARWNVDRQAVEFGVVIGEYRGVVRVSRRVLNACCRSGLLPSGALKRTTYVAERKLRRRQLAEDGNVEITGRDLHEGSAAANARGNRTIAGRLSRG